MALAYALSNWAALRRYTDDGDLAIDNNGAERSLRGIAVGRRNWTFFGSDNGGRTAAVLTSFMASCQRLKIDPWAYLRDTLERIAQHPINKLDELLPGNWKPATAKVRFSNPNAVRPNQARSPGLTGRIPFVCTVLRKVSSIFPRLTHTSPLVRFQSHTKSTRLVWRAPAGGRITPAIDGCRPMIIVDRSADQCVLSEISCIAKRSPHAIPALGAQNPAGRRSSGAWPGCTRSACHAASPDDSAPPGSFTACSPSHSARERACLPARPRSSSCRPAPGSPRCLCSGARCPA